VAAPAERAAAIAETTSGAGAAGMAAGNGIPRRPSVAGISTGKVGMRGGRPLPPYGRGCPVDASLSGQVPGEDGFRHCGPGSSRQATGAISSASSPASGVAPCPSGGKGPAGGGCGFVNRGVTQGGWTAGVIAGMFVMPGMLQAACQAEA
jgi:hypothetical protein